MSVETWRRGLGEDRELKALAFCFPRAPYAPRLWSNLWDALATIKDTLESNQWFWERSPRPSRHFALIGGGSARFVEGNPR
jgi:hypothetical protein